MTVVLGTIIAGLIAAPHLIDVRAVTPSTAITVWLAALVLRALVMLSTLVAIVLILPSTDVFAAVTHWCWHTVVPLMATHLGLDGHKLGDAAVVLPAAALAASVTWAVFGLARAARRVSRLLRRASIGAGPQGSVILEGPDVLLAAAGIRRPRIVVSAGALVMLDDEELAAGLEHERGHIARRHRFIVLFAEMCRALARFLPGTRRAMLELRLHVERDADQWALDRNHDPLALASAICKAAMSRAHAGLAIAGLTGAGVTPRLDELTEDAGPRCSRRRAQTARVLAGTMALFAALLTLALPVATASSFDRAGTPTGVRHCQT